MERKEFTRQKLQDYMKIVEARTPMNQRDYYILKNFGIRFHSKTNEKILINLEHELQYVAKEEIDFYIEMAHSKDHGGIKNTYSKLKKDIFNIKLESVRKYINEKCQFCQLRNKNRKFKNIIPPPSKSPIVSNSFWKRAQIDLVDFRKFKYVTCCRILIYEDNLTGFCMLKPISDEDDSIINALIDIFCIFGAPMFLHIDDSFKDRIRKYINLFWPGCEVMNRKPYLPSSEKAINSRPNDVKQMLISLMKSNQVTDITILLKYVQYLRNISITQKNCPFKALFGQQPVVQLNLEHFNECSQLLSREPKELEVDKQAELQIRNTKLMTQRRIVYENIAVAAKKMIKKI